MLVLGLSSPARYPMDVEVGNSVRNNAQVFQARLLASFAERGRNRIFTRFEMSSHLQPPIQSAVMMQQQASVAIDDETAGGDVAGHKLIPRIRLRRRAQQMQKRGLMLDFARVG